MKPIICTLFAWILLLGLCHKCLAGTTGKVTGQITDTQGNPLSGMVVMIKGTKHGTVADSRGIYFLTSVAPGTYTLIVRKIGYEEQRKTDLMVSTDFTTNQSFTLKESIIEMDEIVVSASQIEQQPKEENLEFYLIEEKPVVIKTVPPSYPEAARKVGLQGEVSLKFLVGKDGRVSNITVIGGQQIFSQPAIDAISQYLYKPAYQKYGDTIEKVDVWLTQVIKFRLH